MGCCGDKYNRPNNIRSLNNKRICEDPCAQEKCDCDINLSSECVYYDGESFRIINLPKGSTVETILKWIDDNLEYLNTSVSNFVNVGDGVPVYKGKTLAGTQEFKTVKSATPRSLKVTATENEVVITPVEYSLELEGSRVKLMAHGVDIPGERSSIDLSGLSSEVTAGRVEGNLLILERSNGKPRVEITLNDSQDIHVSAGRLEGNTIVLERNGADALRIDVSSLRVTPNLVTSGVVQGNSIVLNQSGGSPVTIDVSSLVNTPQAPAGDRLTTFVIQGNNLVINRESGSPLSVDISSLMNVQADYINDSPDNPSFIKNKNPNKVVSNDYTITRADNNYTICVSNSVPVTITVPGKDVLDPANRGFFVSFVQQGLADVTFSGHNVTPKDCQPIIYGQGHIASVEVLNNTTFLFGTLKKL